MPYAFGDSDSAAQRLRLVHQVFSETSRPFLVDWVPAATDLAIDLGCGIGLSTHLIAEATPASHVAGLDTSERFVGLARDSASNRVQFFLHDVTHAPFPVGPADLLYCRLLLTHLPNPMGALAEWATQLGPHRRVLVDEGEDIETHHPVLERYLDLVAELVAHEGGELYIGPRLDAAASPPGLTKEASMIRPLAVENHRTAGMFVLNLQNWKRHPFIGSRLTPEDLTDLETGLRALASTPTDRRDTEWRMRQMVFVRA